ncbi:MAG: MarC family protein [Pseudomonadota bacterium]
MNFLGITTDFAAVTLVSLFTIVNPLGATGMFLGHTITTPPHDVRSIARRASLACALVLIFFAVTGQWVFHVMGISIPAFRIAGGILVFGVSLNMLKGQNVRSRTLPEEQKDAAEKHDISIIPLAIPLLSGPGAITTVIVLMTRSKTFAQDAYVIVSILVISLATYFILVNSSILQRLVGASGVRVMNRLMGLLLAAISIQFIINGLKDLVPDFARLVN